MSDQMKSSSNLKKVNNNNNKNNSKVENKDAIKVDKNSEKYIVALKFVNKILVNIGKEEIDDLIKFQDIDRDEIIKDVNKKTLQEMENEIFKYYDKNKCNYYRKTNSLVLNCLRGMIKQLGLSMTNVKKDITIIHDGLKYRKTHMMYTIK